MAFFFWPFPLSPAAYRSQSSVWAPLAAQCLGQPGTSCAHPAVPWRPPEGCPEVSSAQKCFSHGAGVSSTSPAAGWCWLLPCPLALAVCASATWRQQPGAGCSPSLTLLCPGCTPALRLEQKYRVEEKLCSSFLGQHVCRVDWTPSFPGLCLSRGSNFTCQGIQKEVRVPQFWRVRCCSLQ